MKPSELIYFMALGIVVLLVIAILFFILRKNKKLAMIVAAPFAVLYVGYYLYYPTLQENIHSARFEQLQAYLQATYPEEQFTIYPRELELGVEAGNFMVNNVNTPALGVDYRVKKDGSVVQISTWTNTNFPTEQNLWETVQYNHKGSYTLDDELPVIEKKDSWTEDDLTVFALTINDEPSIAAFHYATGGYSAYPVVEGAAGGIVHATVEQYEFFYIDEHFREQTAKVQLANGEWKELNVAKLKGQLVVFPQ